MPANEKYRISQALKIRHHVNAFFEFFVANTTEASVQV